jgi:hypothetical protein
MKAYWVNWSIAPWVLDLGTRWRWVVSFTLRPLYPRKRAPRTHWIGGRVGPRAGLDAVVKRKIPGPCWDSNHCQLVNKFSTLYGTRRFIALFRTSRHCILSWGRWIKSTNSHTISVRLLLILSFRLRLGPPSYLFRSDFATKVLHSFLISPICSGSSLCKLCHMFLAFLSHRPRYSPVTVSNWICAFLAVSSVTLTTVSAMKPWYRTQDCAVVADAKLRHGPKGQDVQFFRFSEKVMRNKVLKAQLWMYLRGTHYQHGSRHSHEQQADAPAPESPGGGYDGGGGGGSDGGWSVPLVIAAACLHFHVFTRNK